MKELAVLTQELGSGALDARLTAVTGCSADELAAQRTRYAAVLDAYGKAFGRSGDLRPVRAV